MQRQEPSDGACVHALATLATGAMVAGLAAVGAAAPASAAESRAPINGYRNVGYFAQWGVYGRAFQAQAARDVGRGRTTSPTSTTPSATSTTRR